MRVLARVGFVSLLAVGGAQAQSIATSHIGGADAALTVVVPSSSCPVALTAQRIPGGELLSTDGASGGSGENGVYVRVGAPEGSGARILRATLTVHALSARSRVLPVAASGEADVAKSFELTAGKRSASALDGSTFVKNRATVLWVGVDELRYADGRVWRPTGNESCRVEPDGFLPVASAR